MHSITSTVCVWFFIFDQNIYGRNIFVNFNNELSLVDTAIDWSNRWITCKVDLIDWWLTSPFKSIVVCWSLVAQTCPPLTVLRLFLVSDQLTSCTFLNIVLQYPERTCSAMQLQNLDSHCHNSRKFFNCYSVTRIQLWPWRTIAVMHKNVFISGCFSTVKISKCKWATTTRKDTAIASSIQCCDVLAILMGH